MAQLRKVPGWPRDCEQCRFGEVSGWDAESRCGDGCYFAALGPFPRYVLSRAASLAEPRPFGGLTWSVAQHQYIEGDTPTLKTAEERAEFVELMNQVCLDLSVHDAQKSKADDDFKRMSKGAIGGR